MYEVGTVIEFVHITSGLSRRGPVVTPAKSNLGRQTVTIRDETRGGEYRSFRLGDMTQVRVVEGVFVPDPANYRIA